jgi:hypothetical protein
LADDRCCCSCGIVTCICMAAHAPWTSFFPLRELYSSDGSIEPRPGWSLFWDKNHPLWFFPVNIVNKNTLSKTLSHPYTVENFIIPNRGLESVRVPQNIRFRSSLPMRNRGLIVYETSKKSVVPT